MLTTRRVEPAEYREAMSRLAGAVNIVTTDGEAGRRGVTVIAACSVSDNPATLLICLNRNSPLNDMFVRNGVFALNTLQADDRHLADVFAGFGPEGQGDRFMHGDWMTLSTGAPVLKDALVSFDCRVAEWKDMATHRVIFGTVADIRMGGDGGSLVYHRRAYRTLSPQ